MTWAFDYETYGHEYNTSSEKMQAVMKRALDYAKGNLTDGWQKQEDDFIVIRVETFTGITTSKTFRLPDTMTFAGNTILTFYALDGNVKTVWCPVIIPVTSTGVNYHEVARCSEDVLMEALTKVANIENAEAAREAAEFQRNNSENIRIANEATRQSNESERIANWGALQPQMEQIIADTAAAEAAAETINDIYSQMSMTLCYDDEGYPCYAEEE